MRFLADENLPRSIIRYLNSHGYDIKDLHVVNLLESSDEEIGELAAKENRIVLTFDKDFLVPQTIPPSFSVILFHFPRTKPQEIIPFLDILISLLKKNPPRKPFVIIFDKQTIQITN